MKAVLISSEIRFEQDVVFVRKRAREISRVLGFDSQDQTRISTAVSEVARNAFSYAGGGKVEFSLHSQDFPRLVISIRDQGPGIANLDEILEGRYHSLTGMGLGLLGAKRLMDEFEVESKSGQGTVVVLGKKLPRPTPVITAAWIQKITQELMQTGVSGAPFDELREQNLELLRVLNELQSKQNSLSELNRELEDTNRGVVALYAELDEKAEALRKANLIKTRFLSNMTHEFRTPLHAVLQLTRLLLDQSDGPLNSEQERQVKLIRKSIEGLWEMVNDLLDIAKVEAGKVQVRADRFEMGELFSSLRALLKPVAAQSPDVSLAIVDPSPGFPALYTDETKVSQILRNFISNALKFTERGHVDVWAESHEPGWITIHVEDTGIGIAPEYQDKVFEDFFQAESRLHRKSHGTGLGLPLSRKLAELLGGKVEVRSQPGHGSRFSVTLPLRYQGPEDVQVVNADAADHPSVAVVPGRRFLIIDDNESERYLLRSILVSRYQGQVTETASPNEGLRFARSLKPEVIFLDLVMPELSGFEVLEKIQADSELRSIPVIIHSGKDLDEGERKRLSAARAVLSKTRLSEEELIQALESALGRKSA